jgi:hypothetical protein
MDMPARTDERTTLATETWDSAVLLGGALGSMGLFAVALLLVTAWLGP